MAFSFSSSYNRVRIFDVDGTDFRYQSLPELYKELGEGPFEIHGVYINTRGMYEDSPVVALEDRYVNLPAHLTDACRAMLQDKECIEAIKAGKCGFRIYRYTQKKYSRECYSAEWVDL